MQALACGFLIHEALLVNVDAFALVYSLYIALVSHLQVFIDLNSVIFMHDELSMGVDDPPALVLRNTCRHSS